MNKHQTMIIRQFLLILQSLIEPLDLAEDPPKLGGLAEDLRRGESDLGVILCREKVSQLRRKHK